jgi:16S rRNA (adenine1518-N6/adenine1519-N6)-dimethyltransferase
MSQDIIQKYQIIAKKSLGQNFLINQNITHEISNITEIEWKNIIEVGPWYGALTEVLLKKKPSALHLVELDKDMIEILEDRKHIGELSVWETDFKIRDQDVLEFTPEFGKYSVIANIPYYITSPILRHFLYDLENKPENMIILMQKDVGDKILWKWKNKSSVLSLMIEKKCRVEEKIFVWKENFVPAPKIESSVLLFETHNDYDDIDDDKFLEVIKKWFLAPRKKLIKNLVMWWFEKSKIEEYFCLQWYGENVRGEDLGVGEWCGLVKGIKK